MLLFLFSTNLGILLVLGQTDIGSFWDDPCDIGNWTYSPVASPSDQGIHFNTAEVPSHDIDCLHGFSFFVCFCVERVMGVHGGDVFVSRFRGPVIVSTLGHV